MPVANRADALEGFDGISRRCALCFAIDGALQSLGVPGHHAVGDEREGSGGGDEFLCSAAAFGWQRLRADLPLQSVYGLAAFKHVMKRSAKVRQREVITQMHGALQLPGGVASTKDGIPARSAAKSLKHIGRRTPPFLDRGCHVEQTIPTLMDGLTRHILSDQHGECAGHIKPTRHMQPPVVHAVKARTQIESQELCDDHGEIRVAMRVDRESLKTRD